jgi:hypothetical protein
MSTVSELNKNASGGTIFRDIGALLFRRKE